MKKKLTLEDLIAPTGSATVNDGGLITLNGRIATRQALEAARDAGVQELFLARVVRCCRAAIPGQCCDCNGQVWHHNERPGLQLVCPACAARQELVLVPDHTTIGRVRLHN